MVTTRRPALLLGRPNTATHQAKDLHHLDRRAQCQDPVPAQAEQLATAKASVGAEQHEGPVPFVDRLCELEHLVLGQEPHLRLVDLRQKPPHPYARTAWHPPRHDRGRHELGEDLVCLEHRRRR